MKTTCLYPRLALACVALGLVFGCAGQKPALKAGSPIDVTEPVSIAQLSTNPAQFVGQTVRLEGTVSKVCKGSGCWVEVRAADGSSILARSLDHSILVPTDCEGRRIVVQGVVNEILPERSEEASHEEKAQHEGQVAHECPQPAYLVATSGIELY